MTLPDPIRREVADLNAFHLADLADCASPDSADSPGARLLTRVRDAVLESADNVAVADYPDLADTVADDFHDIADTAVDYRTHQRWLQFIDLAAYNDPDAADYGEADSDDLTNTVAGRGLYAIAFRLAGVLAGMIGDMIDSQNGGE